MQTAEPEPVSAERVSAERVSAERTSAEPVSAELEQEVQHGGAVAQPPTCWPASSPRYPASASHPQSDAWYCPSRLDATDFGCGLTSGSSSQQLDWASSPPMALHLHHTHNRMRNMIGHIEHRTFNQTPDQYSR